MADAPLLDDALRDEALKKAAVAWVTVDPHPAVALWCLPLGGVLYVVSGPGEQAAPGLAGAARASVTMRGDHGGRILTWPAAVRRLDPAGEEWAEVAPKLAGKRLNAPASGEALVERWAAECVLSRLAPDGAPLEGGGAPLPAGSLRAEVRETPATRKPRNPFRLHRVRRRGRLGG